MTPLELTVIIFAVSALSGFLGALLGLGGGVFLVPVLSLMLHIDIRYAIGASIVSVIATSSGAAAAYVRSGATNVRLAMVLEIATTSGALSGAFLAGHIGGKSLFIVFGSAVAASGFAMLRRQEEGRIETSSTPDRIADQLQLHGTHFNEASGAHEPYRVSRTPLGFALMYVAGVTSGLLGIGSGALKVPAMDLAMGVPIKISTATSNLMIGVTAAASAAVYFTRGDVDPFITAPVAAGVLCGALVGARAMHRLTNQAIRVVFVIVLLWIAGTMLWKGVQ